MRYERGGYPSRQYARSGGPTRPSILSSGNPYPNPGTFPAGFRVRLIALFPALGLDRHVGGLGHRGSARIAFGAAVDGRATRIGTVCMVASVFGGSRSGQTD